MRSLSADARLGYSSAPTSPQRALHTSEGASHLRGRAMCASPRPSEFASPSPLPWLVPSTAHAIARAGAFWMIAGNNMDLTGRDWNTAWLKPPSLGFQVRGARSRRPRHVVARRRKAVRATRLCYVSASPSVQHEAPRCAHVCPCRVRARRVHGHVGGAFRLWAYGNARMPAQPPPSPPPLFFSLSFRSMRWKRGAARSPPM